MSLKFLKVSNKVNIQMHDEITGVVAMPIIQPVGLQVHGQLEQHRKDCFPKNKKCKKCKIQKAINTCR
jgi:hypothetical protein